jgi:hypothetical protein
MPDANRADLGSEPVLYRDRFPRHAHVIGRREINRVLAPTIFYAVIPGLPLFVH